MIFALSTLPSLFDGQELSAADLNNLAQNTEVLEQIVNGPDRLFLSSWAYAPPMFFLSNTGDISVTGNDGKVITLSGKKFRFSEIDVWEGFCVQRRYAHTTSRFSIVSRKLQRKWKIISSRRRKDG